MRAAMVVDPATSEIQRFGHLLERAGADAVLPVLEAELVGRRAGWIPLVPGEPSGGKAAERDGRWRVVVNVELEVD